MDLMARRRAMMMRKEESNKHWIVQNGILVDQNYQGISLNLIQNQGSVTITGTTYNQRTIFYIPLPSGYHQLVINGNNIESYYGENPNRPSIFVSSSVPAYNGPWVKSEFLPKTQVDPFRVSLDFTGETVNYCGIMVAGSGITLNGHVDVVNFYLE